MIKKMIGIPLLALVLTFGGATPAVAASFDVFDDACKDTQTEKAELCKDNEASKNQSSSDNSFLGKDGLLLKVVNLLQMIVGVAAVIMIIVGGLKYILSTGDPQKINGAKNLILYAIVGLLVTVVARQIIVFVIASL